MSRRPDTYEWQKTPTGKQPFYITSLDGSTLGLAGLWETWVDKETGEAIRSYTILTCDVNPFLSYIHNRMPVVLEPHNYDVWLAGSAEQAVHVICPAKLSMKAQPVGNAVNSPRNNAPTLIEAA